MSFRQKLQRESVKESSSKIIFCLKLAFVGVLLAFLGGAVLAAGMEAGVVLVKIGVLLGFIGGACYFVGFLLMNIQKWNDQ